MRRLALLAALAAAAGAHADDPTRRNFDVDPSRPAALADGAFAVETAAPQARGTAHLELLVDWAHGLLAAKQGGTRLGDLLADRVALHALGSYALGPVELAADLPFAAWQRSNLDLLTSRGVTGPLVDPISSTAFGDLRLLGKVPLPRLLPLDLAALVDLRLPTGDGQAFLSDGLAVNPQLLAGRALGPVRLDASVGYLFRKSGQYLQLVVGDGVTYGLAASTALPPVARLTSWRAVVDLSGQLPRALDLSSDRARAPLSARAGVRAKIWRDLALDVGAGTGLAWFGDAGYGHESFRVFAGLRWERLASAAGPGRPGDRDGDGVPDAEDRCPDQPGPAELEGCPDRDGDGVPDIDDRCPDQPGPAQNDGCPPAAGAPLVEVEVDGRISLRDAITFDTGRDTLRPESGHVLDEVARALTGHPELRQVRVDGHTDNVGGRAYNQDLSARRARAVVRALVQRGVAADRLTWAGFGFDRPVASNATALGRAKNRRVEFTLLPPPAPDKAPAPASPREGRGP
ncbi:MAG TPA: OmpA family protein [Anaeromyxobacteraceae bacterium]